MTNIIDTVAEKQKYYEALRTVFEYHLTNEERQQRICPLTNLPIYSDYNTQLKWALYQQSNTTEHSERFLTFIEDWGMSKDFKASDLSRLTLGLMHSWVKIHQKTLNSKNKVCEIRGQLLMEAISKYKLPNEMITWVDKVLDELSIPDKERKKYLLNFVIAELDFGDN